jgi:hypothetical protein
VNSKSNRVIRLFAFAIGLSVTAMHLSAQQGTFKLPVRAHWGTAVLEPGEHKVLAPLALGQPILYLYSDHSRQMTLPMVTAIVSTERSYLHLTRINGEYYVDAYQSAANGKRYSFAKPKSERKTDSGPDATDSTLVSVSSD